MSYVIPLEDNSQKLVPGFPPDFLFTFAAVALSPFTVVSHSCDSDYTLSPESPPGESSKWVVSGTPNTEKEKKTNTKNGKLNLGLFLNVYVF